MLRSLAIRTRGRGLHEFTDEIRSVIEESAAAQGLCTLFIQHTSASLLVQENADPSARIDLENWLDRLVAEDDSLFTHTLEGPDDMPAHVKAALTATSLSVPISHGELMLGAWQGIYLWEHRDRGGERRVVIHISPDEME